MYNIKVNNSLAFQGSREIFAKELVGNSEKFRKPIYKALTQSELRAATIELMQDLNGMALPKASLEETVGVRKMFAEQATKLYGSTVKELLPQNNKGIIK